MNGLSKKISCVLLIDDDEVTNFYNTHLLTKLGVAEYVHAALDGREALEYLNKKSENDPSHLHPELILLDIHMPIMDGYEFLEAYEQLDPSLRADAIIMMLTTTLMPADKAKADRFTSLSDYCPKPLTEKHLENILSKFFPERLVHS